MELADGMRSVLKQAISPVSRWIEFASNIETPAMASQRWTGHNISNNHLILHVLLFPLVFLYFRNWKRLCLRLVPMLLPEKLKVASVTIFLLVSLYCAVGTWNLVGWHFSCVRYNNCKGILNSAFLYMMKMFVANISDSKVVVEILFQFPFAVLTSVSHLIVFGIERYAEYRRTNTYMVSNDRENDAMKSSVTDDNWLNGADHFEDDNASEIEVSNGNTSEGTYIDLVRCNEPESSPRREASLSEDPCNGPSTNNKEQQNILHEAAVEAPPTPVSLCPSPGSKNSGGDRQPKPRISKRLSTRPTPPRRSHRLAKQQSGV